MLHICCAYSVILGISTDLKKSVALLMIMTKTNHSKAQNANQNVNQNANQQKKAGGSRVKGK